MSRMDKSIYRISLSGKSRTRGNRARNFGLQNSLLNDTINRRYHGAAVTTWWEMRPDSVTNCTARSKAPPSLAKTTQSLRQDSPTNLITRLKKVSMVEQSTKKAIISCKRRQKECLSCRVKMQCLNWRVNFQKVNFSGRQPRNGCSKMMRSSWAWAGWRHLTPWTCNLTQILTHHVAHKLKTIQ